MKRDYGRKIATTIQSFLRGDKALTTRYRQAKQVIRAFRQPAFYEITTECNLSCEGCYYFSHENPLPPENQHPAEDWERFFAHEAKRGVSMAYFVGAEPGLAQERLLAAAAHFPYGNIGTNGTIPIDQSIPYRIGVSLWAGETHSDRDLRGAAVFRKALRNYRGDPRAIMLLTVTRWTIDQIETIAKMCQDHGVALTFNLYSPTHMFLKKLHDHAQQDSQHFRLSGPDHAPLLNAEIISKVHDTLASVLDRFPETVIYSHAFNDFICAPTPLYTLDSEGIAIDCGSRILPPMRYYTTDLKSQSIKCCTAEVDCASCRLYSGGWSSKFVPKHSDIKDRAAFERWIGMIEVLGDIFLYPRDQHQIRE
ncbi:hypothetical protein ACQZV8_15590 [Magnetococcales bacterium HHB-1]